jgi:hypothetical protein
VLASRAGVFVTLLTMLVGCIGVHFCLLMLADIVMVRRLVVVVSGVMSGCLMMMLARRMR